MSDERCKTCRFWGEWGFITTRGLCRKRSPAPTYFFLSESGTQFNATLWPETAEFDWCGDYEPRVKESTTE